MTKKTIPRLCIIGAGKAGRTLGRLWHRAGVFEISDVITRSPESARDAVRFIEAGRTGHDLENLVPADVYMISVPDSSIAEVTESATHASGFNPQSIVFHLSGALASSIFQGVLPDSCQPASVHPVQSFADTVIAVKKFAGTYCGVEGAPAALDVLVPAFKAIGGRIFVIDAEHKPLYHAASVVGCNYLVALMALSLSMYRAAAVDADIARRILEPITKQTLENCFSLGVESALTGPIARGDVSTVKGHLQALDDLSATVNQDAADEITGHCKIIYRELGRIAVKLSETGGLTDTVRLQQIRQILSENS